MKKSVKVYISGTVQGIFFRKFIKDHADRLKVKGYVRNLEDGRVEARFEGNKNEVEEIIELCKQGPLHASIRRIDVIEESFQGLKGFKVLHI